jgi:hypothetical protein
LAPISYTKSAVCATSVNLRCIMRVNTTRSKARARVEHVGDQKNAMGAEIVRTIGIVRARCKIGMVYNMRRFIFLERMAEVAR